MLFGFHAFKDTSFTLTFRYLAHQVDDLKRKKEDEEKKVFFIRAHTKVFFICVKEQLAV